jgi:hypothetical protein
VVHRSDGATALLGLPGFVVGAQIEEQGEWWLAVETTAEVVGCELCGTRAVGHGRRRVRVRDLPMADRPVVLVWANASGAVPTRTVWCACGPRMSTRWPRGWR